MDSTFLFLISRDSCRSCSQFFSAEGVLPKRSLASVTASCSAAARHRRHGPQNARHHDRERTCCQDIGDAAPQLSGCALRGAARWPLSIYVRMRKDNLRGMVERSGRRLAEKAGKEDRRISGVLTAPQPRSPTIKERKTPENRLVDGACLRVIASPTDGRGFEPRRTQALGSFQGFAALDHSATHPKPRRRGFRDLPLVETGFLAYLGQRLATKAGGQLCHRAPKSAQGNTFKGLVQPCH